MRQRGIMGRCSLMLTERNEKGAQSLFGFNIIAVKHNRLNRGVCFNESHSMQTSTRNRVSLGSGWLCVPSRSRLAERRSEVALLSRMNCLFFPSVPWLGSFMFPVVAPGRRTHYQKTLTSISAAPLKNGISVPKPFLFIIAAALLQAVFQGGAAAAAAVAVVAAWHRAVWLSE